MEYGIDIAATPQNGEPQFLVFGVGGGGGNAVEHMVEQNIKGVTFVCANTDLQALNKLSVPNKFQLGREVNNGLGAGGNPEVGRELAESEESHIRDLLQGFDMVFITAGMGGGTGTGAAPVIARIAKEEEKLTVAVVTTPFLFEGRHRQTAAKNGIEELSKYVDSIIVIPNEKLKDVYPNLTMRNAFKNLDDILLYAVSGIVQVVQEDGDINVDFNDLRSAMSAKGYAMMGVGRASGNDRIQKAVEGAIRSPLLDDLRLEKAKGLLVNVVAGEVMMSETGEVAKALEDLVDIEDGQIFYGFANKEEMGDEMQITVIATGLTLDERPRVQSPSMRKAPQPQVVPHSTPAPAPEAVQTVTPSKKSVSAYLNAQQSNFNN